MDRRSKTLLWMVAGCAVLFALVVVGAYVWGPGQTLDNEGLAGFVNANHGWVRPIAWRLTDFGDPPTVAAITLALAALALVRGRPRVAATVIALVAAFLGFGWVANVSWDAARILFFVFIVLAVLAFLGGAFRRPTV